MSEQQSPPCPRTRLGAKLRRMRRQAGLTLDQAASRLDKSRSSMYRIENGRTRVDVHLARSMMDLYGIRDITLLEEVREAVKPVGGLPGTEGATRGQ
ncbi:helix-turn-helix domain-containing protein [Kibdelosporangium persicum]|uniref:helix-turn-helix domain-containing protein n=1 Tax=Kibdelosporangium persicum TaxID=2698649 RepID=UPI0028B14C02|nr:helix-turn-helix transcriptional regulator [Kibdelosporangium persicum]